MVVFWVGIRIIYKGSYANHQKFAIGFDQTLVVLNIPGNLGDESCDNCMDHLRLGRQQRL